MTIVFVGIDLAKNVIALHGVDEAGEAALVGFALATDMTPTMVGNSRSC
ncbi:hypothetical protein ACWA7J_02775 [Leptothrix sp. BB-4]